GLVERHRDRLGGMEAHRGGQLLFLLDEREVEVAHDDLLVRDTKPHARGKSGLLEEALQARGETSTSVTSPSVMRPDGRSRLSAREMRPDEVWTAATKAPSRSRPTEPRGFFLERVRAIGRSLPCPYRTIRTEALEPVEVEIDQLLAGQHRHQAAEGQ